MFVCGDEIIRNLAVCEKAGLLSQFLQYYSAEKRRLNLTKINLGGNQDRHYVGRKPNQPRKRFKGPMPQNEVVIECQKVLADNRLSMGNTQIQPITGSCMEARPKGHQARTLKLCSRIKCHGRQSLARNKFKSYSR